MNSSTRISSAKVKQEKVNSRPAAAWQCALVTQPIAPVNQVLSKQETVARCWIDPDSFTELSRYRLSFLLRWQIPQTFFYSKTHGLSFAFPVILGPAAWKKEVSEVSQVPEVAFARNNVWEVAREMAGEL